jgi:hypothetical protein
MVLTERKGWRHRLSYLEEQGGEWKDEVRRRDLMREVQNDGPWW